MLDNIIVKLLLAPLSLLYGIGISVRNSFYNSGLIRSVKFNLPVISVGNLSVGGAGKTPHIEYLLRLLHDYIEVGTLSRGYKRNTSGYLDVEADNSASEVGDEPLQFRRKFPDIAVSVCENRAYGIPQMVGRHPALQAILLDDAFQHRAVVPGLNIMLTEYARPFFEDFLMPSGRLREWRSAYHRADVLIVSKCPADLTIEQKHQMLEKLKPLAHQKVFFTQYTYGDPYYIFNSGYKKILDKDTDLQLLSAIAGTDYLMAYLNPLVATVTSQEYTDHHNFSEDDLRDIRAQFLRIKSPNKLILTTEKDAMRLEAHREYIHKEDLPIFVLPIEVEFLFNEGPQFDQMIQNYLLNFKV
jgi:tetraacyldisaccharide 4'-kinase